MTEANDNFPTRRALRDRMRGSDASQTSRESRPASDQAESVSTNTSALPAPLHPDGRPMTRREAREWRARQAQQAETGAPQAEQSTTTSRDESEATDRAPEATHEDRVDADTQPENTAGEPDTRQPEAPEAEHGEDEASAPNSTLASMVRESHLRAAESGSENEESTETAVHEQQPTEAPRWSRPVEQPSASQPDEPGAETDEHASAAAHDEPSPDESNGDAEQHDEHPADASAGEAQSATELVEVEEAESVVPEHDEEDAEPVRHRGTWRAADDEPTPEPEPQRDFRDDYHKPSTIVVPEVPENAHLGSPLNSTGEVILTGSVALPRNLSSTGQHSRVDTAEVDRDEDAAFNVTGENEPVRASDAVSSHASTRAVVAPRKSSSSNWPLIAAVGASVAGVGVVVLILGFVFHWFS